jgi:UDP-N-acetylmuramoyl-L-alanyl-D-glutamate--2,6-diaminopimelate ligase
MLIPAMLLRTFSTIQEIAKGRIITVFGCGGDRDNGKHLSWGVVAKWSDLAIITSDNPRTEEPLKIIVQVKAGVSPLEYVNIARLSWQLVLLKRGSLFRKRRRQSSCGKACGS